ncbi:hypothetical protein K6119_12720 [Paracrocinitomix mangrovi]|uniref:hypothetical protein n=1 Tax=Paracrocinitomix mangrovi TaxID=2862509 RepID=UPI001C8EF464|nr:hypothetical protein [Paracrocinitomix mangrovi]UKN00593.1 hypothetical protein K6119_12720 [Paracrocinitomix mangrovi]
MTRILTVLLLVITVGCGSESENTESQKQEGALVHFNDFPEYQFDGIKLGDDLKSGQHFLADNGYEEKTNQVGHFWNDSLQIEVILSDEVRINQFKVFFFEEETVQNADVLKNFFTEKAKSSSLSEEYSVFEFESENSKFSLTLFSQNDILRIQFQLKSSH